MIEQGTLFNVDGMQFKVTEHKIVGGQHIIRAEPFILIKPQLKTITDNLFDKLKHEKNVVVGSEIIVDWFLDCKGLLMQNSSILMSVKKQLFALELRRIYREGESWEEIVNVLLFSFNDKFWGENLLKCYRNLASNDTRSGIPIYKQIKAIMLSTEEKVEVELDGNSDL
jgi:hypothetical protein